MQHWQIGLSNTPFRAFTSNVLDYAARFADSNARLPRCLGVT